jgi:hypothetical protein
MNSLWTGSTWLLTTAAALSPLIALLIGFAGTDRLLRWQLAEKRDPTKRTTTGAIAVGIADLAGKSP